MSTFHKGERFQMTDAWRIAVVEAMHARGITQDKLATMVGAAGRGTISKILKTGGAKQSNSSLVPKICEVLGVPLPLMASPDPKTARVMQLLEKSPEEVKDSILAMLEAVVKQR